MEIVTRLAEYMQNSSQMGSTFQGLCCRDCLLARVAQQVRPRVIFIIEQDHLTELSRPMEIRVLPERDCRVPGVVIGGVVHAAGAVVLLLAVRVVECIRAVCSSSAWGSGREIDGLGEGSALMDSTAEYDATMRAKQEEKAERGRRGEGVTRESKGRLRTEVNAPLPRDRAAPPVIDHALEFWDAK